MEVKQKLTASQRSRGAGARRRALANAGRPSGGGTAATICFTIGAALLAFLGQHFYSAHVAFPPPVPLANVTAPRVTLADGRQVAYSEAGAPAADAKRHVLFLHPWQGSRLYYLAFFPPALLKELKVRMVSYDRPGYGQSDPNPGRTPQSEAEDIAQIADLLEMGSKFHVLAFSMGGYAAWACLRYIPERLAGVGMVAPILNYWWRSRTDAERAEVWKEHVRAEDRYTLLIARHAPFLLHWWLTQRVFPRGNYCSFRGDAVTARMAPKDMEGLASVAKGDESAAVEAYRQGPAESWYRDLLIMAGDWGFDLSDIHLDPGGSSGDGGGGFHGAAHLWQGTDDWAVPAPPQRLAARVLPALNYHEVEGEGHLFLLNATWARAVLTQMLGLQGAGGWDGVATPTLPDQFLKLA